MSKPAPVHADSPRPRSPASALFTALRRLTASRAALPVHGVSTTPATTPQLPSADKASQLRPSSAPRSPATRHLGHELRVSGLAPITRQGHISQCPCVQPPRSNRSERPADSYRHRGRPYLPILGVVGCSAFAPAMRVGDCRAGAVPQEAYLRDPRSREDLPHPAPARQAAPVLGIGRIDPMAKPGAPDGRRRRGRGRRAHHVRVGRSERVLRVLQDAAGLAGARVSPAGWIAGQGPAPRLRARVAGYLDDQPRGGGARARRGVPGCAGVRLAGSAHAPARCGRRHAQQRDQQAPRGWPRRENTCPHGRWTHPVTGRFPSPAPAGDPARLPGGTPPPGGAPPGETGAIWVRRR
jgi:hypothetical protein